MGWTPTQHDPDITGKFLMEYAEWLKAHQPHATIKIRILEEAYFNLPSGGEEIFEGNE